jgi:uncharacterized protein
MLKKSTKKQFSPFVRFLMVTAGLISVGLGILGIVLPILPTTPFFLLATYLFVRSSQKYYRWLLSHKLFGNYIRNYIYKRAISKEVKISTLSLLWASILISVIFATSLLWLRILLILIAIGVSIHILMLNTMKDMDNSEKVHPKLKRTRKSAV